MEKNPIAADDDGHAKDAKPETAVTTAKNAGAKANAKDTKKTAEAAVAKQSNENKAISMSDGEQEAAPALKPNAKKRSSMGNAASSEHEESDTFRLKRRKIKVAGAPKMPLNGYVRYMNDRRDELRKEFPAKTAMEHTKIIGEEWHQLTEESKAPYMKAAEEDKKRYLSELNTFLKARPEVLASEMAKDAKLKKHKGILKEKPQLNGNGKVSKEKLHNHKDFLTPTPGQKRKRTPTPPNTANIVAPNSLIAPIPPGTEIPIFTNDFLEHNKYIDAELRTLRKSRSDLEQQNAVLEKHVENMKSGVEKMVSDNNELEEKNRLLQIYLDKLKQKLVSALGGLAIPTQPHGATMDNIDKYMQDLYLMTTSNNHPVNKARDIIRKLDLQIQL